MPLALKSLATFTSANLQNLINEACRLELAGVKSFLKPNEKFTVSMAEDSSEGAHNPKSFVEEITDNVIKKLQMTDDSVNFVGVSSQYLRNRGGDGRIICSRIPTIVKVRTSKSC